VKNIKKELYKMDKYTLFPDSQIYNSGIISEYFLKLGITYMHNACKFVHELPYGYNSTRNDILILFKENKGTCSTKHAVIAKLAEELNIPIVKYTGIYKMNEDIVTGTNSILEKYNLPYLPMIHCFLVYESYKVDLTEGNNNGKKHSIEDFLYSEKVIPEISEKDEYLIYRKYLIENILLKNDMHSIELTQVLNARQEGIKLLRSKVV
jgi:hypothetical protein